MLVGVLPGSRSVVVGDRPADVVVAAHVGDPRRAGGSDRHRPQRARHQLDTTGGERAPQQHHQRVVVREVALAARVPAEPEVADEVVRRDDRLRLEGHRGRDHPHDRAVGLQQLVHLGLVLAVRAEPLPHERHGVEPQHVDAGVRQEQEVVEHRREDRRVRVVEIPLPGVERGPDPAAELLGPREVRRLEVREHQRQRALEGVRLRAVGIGEEEVAEGGVAGDRALRPLVLARRVVDHEVDAQAHAVVVQRSPTAPAGRPWCPARARRRGSRPRRTRRRSRRVASAAAASGAGS